MNYEQDLRIDGQSLDQEWLRQPGLFMKYSKELADARERLDRVSEKVDVVTAEADTRVRIKLAAEGTKATESMVKSGVVLDAAYKQASEEYIKAKHDVDILTAAVRAFDHRKDALENLVRLHGQNYFAGPTVPYDIGREFRAQTDARGREEARQGTAAATAARRRA